MFKHLVLIMVVCQLSHAQKSFYAGQQSWYPKVLAKYTSTTSSTPVSLDNRVNENTVSLTSALTESSISTLSPISDNDKFIQRVSSWPVDKQPFWYKNREAIASMIQQQIDGGNAQNAQRQQSTSRFSRFSRRDTI